MTKPLAEELDAWEQLACSPPDTYEKAIIAKLVSYARTLQHELNDPNYQYVGRIHRQAIIYRNLHIDQLEEEIKTLKALSTVPNTPTGE